MNRSAILFERSNSYRQKGFTSVEYVLVTAVVIAMLFVPFPGSQGLSAVGMLLAGLRSFQMHSVYLLSLP